MLSLGFKFHENSSFIINEMGSDDARHHRVKKATYSFVTSSIEVGSGWFQCKQTGEIVERPLATNTQPGEGEKLVKSYISRNQRLARKGAGV